MRGASLPGAGDQVEVSVSTDVTYTTWVDQADGDWLSVFCPHDVLIGDLPGEGTVVTIRWHSPRGRHHVEAAVLGVAMDGGTQWEVEVVSDIGVTQDRQYVRGAGGEPMQMWRRAVEQEPAPAVPAQRPGADAAEAAGGGDGGSAEPEGVDDDPERALEPRSGTVVDLSERGVRARFTDVALLPGDPVGVRVVLDGEAVELHGHVLRMIPGPSKGRTDVVAVYEPYEDVAAQIRRYVLQAQLRARQLAAR